MKTKVIVSKCRDYSQIEVERAMKLILVDLFSCIDIKLNSKILLKPNLLKKSKPEAGIITHPAILESLIKALQKFDAKITIADSSGTNLSNTDEEFLDICKESGILDLQKKYPSIKIEAITKGIRKGKFIIFDKLENFDVVINIGKLKTHTLTYYSGAIKNMYGIIPGKYKLDYHARFNNPQDFVTFIAELYAIAKPDYNIIDAVISMEGNGPAKGKIRNTQFILGSVDGFCADYVAIKTVRLDVNKCLYLSNDFNIKQIGKVTVSPQFEEPNTILEDDNLRHFVKNKNRFIEMSYPYIIEHKCIMCKKCISICPQKAIIIINKKIKINYKKCIKCHCCNELIECNALKLSEKLNEYHGILVDYCLKDKKYLETFNIIGQKPSVVIPWQLYKVSVPKEKIKDVIKDFQKQFISDKQFYAHFYKGNELIVVYKDKIFMANPHNKKSWKASINYGLLKKIPLEQLNFSPCKFEDEKY